MNQYQRMKWRDAVRLEAFISLEASGEMTTHSLLERLMVKFPVLNIQGLASMLGQGIGGYNPFLRTTNGWKANPDAWVTWKEMMRRIDAENRIRFGSENVDAMAEITALYQGFDGSIRRMSKIASNYD